MHRNLLDAIPAEQRESFRALLARVRNSQCPSGVQFDSLIRPGELRAAYAQLVANHAGWLSISVFALRAAVPLPTDDDEQDGAVGACLVGTLTLAQFVSAWIF
jgi:hypothetical protein